MKLTVHPAMASPLPPGDLPMTHLRAPLAARESATPALARTCRSRRLLHLAALALSAVVEVGCNRPQASPVATKPPEVFFEHPVVRTVTDYEEFTGRTESPFAVEVRARVNGFLDKAHFKEGADVKPGDLLFEIDPRPYEADLKKAESDVLNWVAQEKLAQAELERTKRGVPTQAFTREDYDKAVAQKGIAEASIKAAQAALERARLNLDWTRVYAKQTGRISHRLVDPGNIVKADETPLTTIVSLDPMYAYFDVDQRTVLRLRRQGPEGTLNSADAPGIVVQVGLADEDDYSLSGTIDFVDNKVDPNSGTLRLRAVIPNPKRLLSPGLFVRLRLPVSEPHRAVLVPEQALAFDQGQKFVYVLNEKDEVVYRHVKAGAAEGGLRVIEPMDVPPALVMDVATSMAQEGWRVAQSSLKASDRVVVTGLQRVRSGGKVTPKPAEPSVDALAAASVEAPTPQTGH